MCCANCLIGICLDSTFALSLNMLLLCFIRCRFGRKLRGHKSRCRCPDRTDVSSSDLNEYLLKNTDFSYVVKLKYQGTVSKIKLIFFFPKHHIPITFISSKIVVSYLILKLKTVTCKIRNQSTIDGTILDI